MWSFIAFIECKKQDWLLKKSGVVFSVQFWTVIKCQYCLIDCLVDQLKAITRKFRLLFYFLIKSWKCENEQRKHTFIGHTTKVTRLCGLNYAFFISSDFVLVPWSEKKTNIFRLMLLLLNRFNLFKKKNIIKTPTYNQLGCSWLNPFHIYSWIVDILFHSLLSKRHKLWRCRRDTHNHKSQPQ